MIYTPCVTYNSEQAAITTEVDMKEELKKLALAATPKPWEWHSVESQQRDYGRITTESGSYIATVCNEKDAAYIAAACPANILALIESHEAIEKQRDELQAKIDELNEKIRVQHVIIGSAQARADLMMKINSANIAEQAIAKHKGD